MAVLCFACSRTHRARDDSPRGARLADHIEVLEDPSGSLSFESVTSADSTHSFVTHRGPVNLGVTKSVFWFRMNVDPREYAGADRWVIALGAHLDDITAYASTTSEPGRWQRLAMTQLARNRTVFVAFDLPADTDATRLLFRVRTSDTLFFSPTLQDAQEYAEQQNAESLRKGVYYGLVMGAVIYNLFLAIWLRDKSYALYVLFEAAFCATIACMDRTIIAVLPWMLPTLRHGLAERIMIVTGFVAVLFAREFLDLRASSRIWRAALVAGVVGGILVAMPSSAGRQWLYVTSYVFILYTTTLVSFMAVWSLRRGNANAPLFTLAWGAVLAATLLGSLSNLGVVMPRYSVIDSLRLGSAVEAMLLAVALARRMNLIRRAEERARIELADARLRLSEMLQRQVTSLNTLVGGVAHEIGNPLNFAAGGAREAVQRIRRAGALAHELAEQGSVDGAKPLREVLELAGRAAALAARGTERIESIVKNLRTYVGAERPPLESIDVDDCIRSTIALLDGNLQAKRIDVILELGLCSRIPGSASEMQQVIMNLVLNATHAMPDGGTVFIRSEETTDSVRIVIADTGAGVPPSKRHVIFDPFFTTRAPNEGMGLGLAVSREVARRHGGTLELLPQGSRGAEFELRLPRPRQGGV
jgi:two-component system, NtrC family, sensor kinase